MKRKETKISVFRMFVEVVGYLLLMHSGPIASLGLRQIHGFKTFITDQYTNYTLVHGL